MKVLLCFFLLLCFHPLACPAQEALPTGRLPEDVQPVSYDLSLTIVPEQERFSGEVRVRVRLAKERQTIWMHGRDLQVHKSTVTLGSGKTIAANYSQVTEDGVARLDLPEPVAPQIVTLVFAYDAPFNRKLEGLYRVDEGGRSYAFSQFEAIAARLCFPGFDEPAFKTPFDITLTVKKEHQAITNTIVVSETPLDSGLKQIRFARTPNLPTYLLAFAVGDLDVVSGPDIPPNSVRAYPVPLHGVAVKGKGKDLNYALQNTGSILKVLEEYLGIPYPFQKLDVIAVPDFDWGAMENAGAIVFREELLLLDEKNAPVNQKQRFASVMAHELAHQWFGDLVTMPWWNDIWLNESFATWMARRSIQEWNPEFREGLTGLLSVQSAMDQDSVAGARPTRREVEDAGDIRAIADFAVFSKGGGLLFMFESYAGEEKFRQAIRHHLSKYSYSNATTQNFLDSLVEIAGKELRTPFQSFLDQPGVPFLEFRTVCSGTSSSLELKQSRYLPLGSHASADPRWEIPVCVRFGAGKKASQKCFVFSEKAASVDLTENDCPEWLMPNSNGSGYYRWGIPEESYAALQKLPPGALSEREELSIADSVNSSFSSGRLSAAQALKALAPFASSAERSLAKAPMELIEFSRDHLGKKSEMEQFSSNLYQAVYEKLGFASRPTDTEDNRLFRIDLIDFLAFAARDRAVRSEANKRGRAYVGAATNNQIHPDAVDSDLVPVALGVAVQEGDEPFFDLLVKLLKESNDSLLRDRILTALGKADGSLLAQKALALSLDPTLRVNEIAIPLEQQLKQMETRESAWEFLKQNFDSLTARLSPTDGGALPRLAESFCSEARASDVEQFFASRIKTFPGGERSLRRCLEYIRICAAKASAPSQ